MNLANAHTTKAGAVDPGPLDDFGAVVERYQSLVWAVAYSITGDQSLSEDVAQETFLAAWSQQGDIRDLSKLKGYLATIARNLAKKSVRGTGREVVVGDGDSQTSEPAVARGPLDEVLSREELSQVAVALGQMPIPSREAFVLFYADGQSVARVAEELELSQSAVKQRLYRARESLKDSIETTLSKAIAAGTPGKAFTVATMTMVAQSATAGAAAAHASIGNAAAPEVLAKTQGIASGASGKMAGAAVLVASVTVVVFLVQAVKSADPAAEAPATTDLPATAIAAEAQPDPSLVNPRPHHAGQLKSAQTNVPVATTTAMGQELLFSRIQQNWPGADFDGDGQLSEVEILTLRDEQEDELTKQILKHWQDEPCAAGSEVHAPFGVTCAFVGETDEGQAVEGFTPYNLYGLRARYEEKLEAGLDMDATQWVASKVATAQKDRICYEISASHHDLVHELRSDAQGVALPWVASVTFEDHEPLRFSPPKELKKELASVADQFEADEVANRWGVQILVLAAAGAHEESDDSGYLLVASQESQFADWDQLTPAMQAAVAAARQAERN